MSNRKNVTIKDIARMSGVSAGTVDRVLHNRGRVSEDALQKVMSVLSQIDYKPNLIARTLGAGKAYKIAALLPDPQQDPYWAQCFEGVHQAGSEWTQYGLSIEAFHFNLYDKESFKAAAEAADEAKPDGILIAPIFYHETLPFFSLYRRECIPYVLFNTNIREAHPLSFIGQNLYQSGRVGAELMHLGQPGPGTFAVVHTYEDTHNAVHLAEKERGFRDYFQQKNKEAYNVLSLDILIANGSPASDASVKEQIKTLLDVPDLKGIFVSTSTGASLIASCVEERGRGHIRLVGYDLLEENMKYMRSGVIDFLINQSPKRQALLGISHLANHLLFRKQAPAQSLFPLEVITQENLESYLDSKLN